MIKIYGFNDFYSNKLLIKSHYKCMTIEEKQEFKRYVYSISFENEYTKDVIWEYLNEDEMAEDNLERLKITREKRCKNIGIRKQ